MATAWQKKFGAQARRCFAQGPTSAKAFGKCMKSGLGSSRKSRKSRRSRRRR